MIITALSKITCFVNSPVIRTFHYDMFHGTAEREGIAYHDSGACFLNTTHRKQLHISRTGQQVPAVFAPSLNLVLSEEVRKRLIGLPKIDVLPVVFDKLFQFYYRKGDFSWYDAPLCADSQDLHRILPDVPDYHSQVGPYYELLVARTQDLATESSDMREVTITIGPASLEETVEVRLPVDLWGRYPIVWDNGCLFFAEGSFQRIEPFLDWDFFAKTVFELDAGKAQRRGR